MGLESPVWVMQYYYWHSEDLLVWPEYFSSPEEGEEMVKKLNRDKLVGGFTPITVAWYKRVNKHERV